jgi:hypothetical protein
MLTPAGAVFLPSVRKTVQLLEETTALDAAIEGAK